MSAKRLLINHSNNRGPNQDFEVDSKALLKAYVRHRVVLIASKKSKGAPELIEPSIYATDSEVIAKVQGQLLSAMALLEAIQEGISLLDAFSSLFLLLKYILLLVQCVAFQCIYIVPCSCTTDILCL
ncbi:unnamed protein product [Toxocara canis]|uniref:ACOX domain-containing protein n=1 Tax=Toxocara canis TaxID=6265 RepID=A0A183TVG1_TOXCA|nr:unnamed protein product [Toxocara canis]